MIRVGRWDINRETGAAFVDAVEVLRCLYRNMGANPPGRSASRLAVDLHLHHDELNAVLEALSDLGMVVRTQEQRWILACDPRRAALAPLFDRFVLDRNQRRLRESPEILRVARATLTAGVAPTLEDLMQEAQNTGNGSADILKDRGPVKISLGVSPWRTIMLKVSEILRVKGDTLFTATPDTRPSAWPVQTMSLQDIGSLVIMESSMLVGMLTFREIIQHA